MQLPIKDGFYIITHKAFKHEYGCYMISEKYGEPVTIQSVCYVYTDILVGRTYFMNAITQDGAYLGSIRYEDILSYQKLVLPTADLSCPL